MGFLVIAVAAVLVGCGSWFHAFAKNELDTLDLRFRLRPPTPKTSQVVIIEIDNDTIKKIGQFPFHRGYHAKLVDALAAGGASSVVFDMFFSEPRAGDKDLIDAMTAAGNVYLPYVFDLTGRAGSAAGYSAQNLPELTAVAKGTGYINVLPDPDGKFRRVPLYVEYQGKRYPSMALLFSAAHLGVLPAAVKIPLDENGNVIVNFAGPWAKGYRHFSFGDILQAYEDKIAGKKPRLDLNIFKDKVCLVGYTADGTTDLHPSPLEPLYPSIGIHADIFNSIVHRDFIVRVSRSVNLVVLGGLFFLILTITLKAPPMLAFGLFLEISAVFLAISVMLFNRLGVWVDVFYPVLMMTSVYLLCTLYKSIAHLKERIIFENELKNAKEIQESFVPVILPEIDGVDVAATMFMAREVGGDLYDVVKHEDGKVGVMVGDVMGKGFPASLFMAMAASSFKFFALQDVAPDQALLELNEKIIRETPGNRFVTIFYSVFDFKSRRMVYANGGHMPVIYFTKDKQPVSLDVEDGLPLGMMKGVYSKGEMRFDSGDIFVYYTDGVTEAKNVKKEMYGVDRLMAFVQMNKALSAAKLRDGIIRDVTDFLGKCQQQDDITLIVIKVEV
ncbi:MAG: CHASE2 domain-containing protein [Candidatus Omnitrophica bacterium]|nr:CHASE2 domain-containing protein [Candidatus Omnitrophota bacterium]